MSDWRETDPTGCVHRFEVEVPARRMPRGNEIAAHTRAECRRFPRQMYGSPVDGMGDRFPSCEARCGEFDAGEPEMLVLPKLTAEQIAQFKRAWSGKPPTILATGEPIQRIERRPGAAYGFPPHPPADED